MSTSLTPTPNDRFFTPQSSPTSSDSEDVEEDQASYTSIPHYYQHGENSRPKKWSNFTLIYYPNYDLIEGYGSKWKGSCYWSTTEHININDNTVSFVNKPSQITDYIKQLKTWSKFDGMVQAPQQINVKRGFHLHRLDWELLKREKKIKWTNSSMKWMPCENTR